MRPEGRPRDLEIQVVRDDGRTGPLTHGSGRMGSKDPAGISGCMSYLKVADVGPIRLQGTTCALRPYSIGSPNWRLRPGSLGGSGSDAGSGCTSGTIETISAMGADVRGVGARRFQGRPCGLLLSLLLGGSVASPKRLSTGEHHRRVLALVAHTRALAVVERRLAEPFLRHLLEPALEVLVLRRGRERAVAVEVIVVSGVVSGVKEHGAQHSLESIREQ